jgi:hypothetical protein
MKVFWVNKPLGEGDPTIVPLRMTRNHFPAGNNLRKNPQSMIEAAQNYSKRERGHHEVKLRN